MLKVVGIDAGKRVNPVVSLREAKKNGHHTAFPQNKCLGVLSTCGVPSGFLETPNKKFEVIISARQEGLGSVPVTCESHFRS